MLIAKSIFFYISLTIWTIIMGVLCFPFMLLPSKMLKYPAKIWIKVIFLLLDKICNISHKIDGLENIPEYSVLVVSKHQSAFETFVFYYYLNDCFLQPVLYIPLY